MPWPERCWSGAVALSSGGIVLLGGSGSGSSVLSDVWRSKDGGTHWTQLFDAAPWPARCGHGFVALPDDAMVLAGGAGADGSLMNDVWRSSDGGSTWEQLLVVSPWPPRVDLGAVALPDGAMLLLGGSIADRGMLNDIWRSEDGGTEWKRLNTKLVMSDAAKKEMQRRMSVPSILSGAATERGDRRGKMPTGQDTGNLLQRALDLPTPADLPPLRSPSDLFASKRSEELRLPGSADVQPSSSSIDPQDNPPIFDFRKSKNTVESKKSSSSGGVGNSESSSNLRAAASSLDTADMQVSHSSANPLVVQSSPLDLRALPDLRAPKSPSDLFMVKHMTVTQPSQSSTKRGSSKSSSHSRASTEEASSRPQRFEEMSREVLQRAILDMQRGLADITRKLDGICEENALLKEENTMLKDAIDDTVEGAHQ